MNKKQAGGIGALVGLGAVVVIVAVSAVIGKSHPSKAHVASQYTARQATQVALSYLNKDTSKYRTLGLGCVTNPKAPKFACIVLIETVATGAQACGYLTFSLVPGGTPTTVVGQPVASRYCKNAPGYRA